MSRNTNTGESKITTDRETIRGWVGEHDATPVRYSGVEGESGTLRIVPESRTEESHERLTWDDFFEEIDRNEQVVVYHGTDHPEPFEVTTREEAIGRTTIADESVEEALLEGETVTSEVTETTVIERTIVEEATIESEVAGRETISEEVVDVELLTRDVVECELLDGDAGVDRSGVIDFDTFEPGNRSTFEEGLGIELTVDEGWTVTKEIVERPIIESRIVDTESTETDTVEADTVQSAIDVEGVQRTVVESDLVDTEAGVDVIESGSIQSEFREGDIVETRLVERKTVDEEVSLRRRLTGTITEGETLEADTVSRQVIESEIIGEADVEGETPTAASTEPAREAETVSAGDVGDEAVMPTEDDEGKTVVDASGEEVGLVVDVRGDTVYVDPHPSIADRIRTTLGWGESDADDYTIGPDRIARITNDRVELTSIEPSSREGST